jgi:hypothetical protein
MLSTNLLSLPNADAMLETTRTWIAPDLWTEEFAFRSKPGHSDIQRELLYDSSTKLDSYPTWQAWMLRKAASFARICGKYDLPRPTPRSASLFCRQDIPNAQVYISWPWPLRIRHAKDEIAALIRGRVFTTLKVVMLQQEKAVRNIGRERCGSVSC